MRFFYEMIKKLAAGEPFRFSRWGDGEWGCMYGWQGANRDGNTYLPELRDDLTRIILSAPDYYIGIQSGLFYGNLRTYVLKTLFGLNLNIQIGDVLHYASEFGYLKMFTNALKNRNVWVIGADYFNKLPYKHIIIPGANSYFENEFLFNQIELSDVTGYNVNPVYLVAAAMNSNVIIDLLPESVTAIDIGSVFDPYLGKPRAGYQHKMNVKINDLW